MRTTAIWGSPKMRQVAGLSPRDLQAMQRSLPCRESVVYIIVTLGEMLREQVFFHPSRESSSWTLWRIDLEEPQVSVQGNPRWSERR